MEFSYKLTEAEYLRASKLRLKRAGKGPTFKKLLIWVLVLVCLMILWGVVTRIALNPAVDGSAPVPASSECVTATSTPPKTDAPLALLFNLGPLLLLLAVWFTLVTLWLPGRLRRMYQNDPAAQGLFTVNVTAHSFAFKNTAGVSSEISWNIYERWIDGGNLVLLVNYSQAAFTISLAGLSDVQRAELRGILSAALPKKWSTGSSLSNSPP
ncbi:MAG TPA: hypothetical protein VME23_06335 [Terracidiphilus sp.]|nr:hypothetical protein [Terracidiphilus sp.]